MVGFNARSSRVAAILMIAAAGALAACSDETTGTTSASTTSSSSSSGSSSGSSSSSSSSSGAGGSMCVPGPVAAKTIKGTVSYAGTAMAADTLRIVAFKDGDPMAGAPAGYVFSPAGTAPTFPYAYEIMIDPLPPEGTGMYGVIAYLDVGSDNIMGPDMMEDPGAMPSKLVTVDDCQGATVDFTLMDPPP